MINITFPHGINIPSELIEKNNAMLIRLVTALSERFNITGLSEIAVVENIETPHLGEFVVAGELHTIYKDPIEHKLQVVGTIYDVNLIGNKQVFDEFVHMLHHELAHIHDHNEIIHIYRERETLKAEPSQENVLWEFTLKIWSEFMATQLSSDGNALMRINHNINQVNLLHNSYLSAEARRRFALVTDMVCYMAYLLGDVIKHESLADEIGCQIDVGHFAPFFEQLYDELQSLLSTYPRWQNIYVLKDLRNVIQGIFNKINR